MHSDSIDAACKRGRDGADACASAADGPYESLADELMRRGFELSRLKPARSISESTRGLPAVMAELLVAGEPLSSGELARRTGVTDARIANILKVLESKGYVERRPSSKDRRRVEVVPTSLGREVSDRRRLEGKRFVAEFLSDLGEQDAQDLVRVLGKVVEVVAWRRAQGRDVAPGEFVLDEE